jgi:hypothetical protein
VKPTGFTIVGRANNPLLIGVPRVVSGVIVVVTKLIAALIPVLLLLGSGSGCTRNRSSSIRASSPRWEQA